MAVSDVNPDLVTGPTSQQEHETEDGQWEGMRGCQIRPPPAPAMALTLSTTALRRRSPFPASPHGGVPQRGAGVIAWQTPCQGNGGFGASRAPQRDLTASISSPAQGFGGAGAHTPGGGAARERDFGRKARRSYRKEQNAQSQLPPNEQIDCFYQSHGSICPNCLIR